MREVSNMLLQEGIGSLGGTYVHARSIVTKESFFGGVADLKGGIQNRLRRFS
jgi:hypothetical protein